MENLISYQTAISIMGEESRAKCAENPHFAIGYAIESLISADHWLNGSATTGNDPVFALSQIRTALEALRAAREGINDSNA